MLIHCMRCKKKTETDDPEEVTMKNGKPACRGTCVECKAVKYRIGTMPQPA